MVRVPLMLVLVLASCGRIGFDATNIGDGHSSSDGVRDGVGDGAGSGNVAYVGSLASHDFNTGSSPTDSFTLASPTSGDAVVVHVYCKSPAASTAVGLTAVGWTFTQLGPITGSAATQDWVASFVAIAPVAPTEVTNVTWTVAGCGYHAEIADEFGNARTDISAFYAHDEASGGSGTNCSTNVTVSNAGDLVWSACSADGVTTGAGFTMGTMNIGGEASEFAVATGPGPQVASFTNTNSWAATTIAIAHR